ncbi:MAG TPA: hypothetical protein PKY77_11630 [Phycisphaerae bacterium]|nr:hypothetical protein [Phycisphaerae bacterium]HRY70524.1 hypothetical protein [Phycisphaerae bacterium]HSA27972.1 hypothetical protein [Phycisphaerae bacterium]
MTLLYAATLFASAALLFSLEPMVGKMVLPALGGTPAVWNTCMVFFQTALLAGYAYAHGIGGRFGLRGQASVHVGLLALGLVALPITLAAGNTPVDQDNPVFWLLGRLALSVGLPFLAISGTAPLLQKWFAQAQGIGSEDPYFLYAASNAGSLAALLAYPLLVERLLDLDTQARVWAFGYVGLIILIAVCGGAVWMAGGPERPTPAKPDEEGGHRNGGRRARRRAHGSVVIPPSRQHKSTTNRELESASGQALTAVVDARRRGWWVVLAAVPSSLMLGVTTHITTNVAAMPLLWVVPLATYLLTFILCFARRERISVEMASRWFPFIALLVAPLYFLPVPFPEMEWQFMGAHLIMFFLGAVICHGRLARNRPDPRHLTEYYLWISLGGVLGGVFNALLAPLIFTRVVEYPMVVCLACLLRPKPATSTPRERWLDFLLPCAVAVLAGGAALAVDKTDARSSVLGLLIVFAVTMVCGVIFRRRSLRFCLTYAASLMAMGLYARQQEGDLLHVERNFFGVKRVLTTKIEVPIGTVTAGAMHTLYHGTTLHGVQFRNTDFDAEPLAYYHPGGPIADLFSGIVGSEPGRRIGAVGLGAGAVAAYTHPGQCIDFYEIDPAVARIAGDPKYFAYLSACRGDLHVILGDGRLKLAGVADGTYALLLLDAYSSDAIPTHMLSREALGVYLAKLDPHGAIAFHITNRFMNLAPLLANLAKDVGLVCRVRSEQWTLTQIEEGQKRGYFPADVAVMARREEDLGVLAADKRWQPAKEDPELPIWTDRYSDVVGLVLRGQRTP